ncbi:mannitol dehydrogenase family protein [Afifella marina]|nr:mannitol dehydrogenase family protein [Afifella marina]MBK1622135.1 mannitol dehydrogenase [Afifella marina DSM 2698]MBK1628261.1 mannitol dehydrogenase [Afifella marina]MBK5918919.1 mannitol dehydrogenase [Afifella marina]RAI17780.1 mannitol dehydrogenase [Afifella marina DSM 2698]
MTTKLAAENLTEISSRVHVPGYDRAGLSAGILHFGIGNFHRAHQAVYLDELFETGRDHDFAILGAGVMAGDEKMRQALSGQDFLTTVVDQSAAASNARVTGAMVGMLPVGDAQAIIEKLTDPSIRIVSLTVTEGGYFIDSTGRFNPEHPAIAADGKTPDDPKTVFGLIAAGLKERRGRGLQPFTVMSCDNIPHNGVVAKNAVAGTARLSDPAFADWITENVAFPNGMVDRITPATGDRERRLLEEEFGVEDAWPVFCEDFKQWVLEDNFPSGRPALQNVGVQFVPDVTPFEIMKIRILNGGHAVIAYPAGLLDIHFVHEAMEHPLVAAFLEKIEQDEIVPAVPPVPDTDLQVYFGEIKRRFANPKIGDTVRRLCLDGSNRQPKFIVPTIADRLKEGRSVAGLALESALWCRYCFGETESGAVIEPNDPNWDLLVPKAQAARADPGEWLGMDDVYGDVGRNDDFRELFAHWLRTLWDEGTEKTLQRYLDGTR